MTSSIFQFFTPSTSLQESEVPMKAVAFVVAVAVCFAVSNGQGTVHSGDPDAPPPTGPSITVPHDSIPALAQPNPTTDAEKSAIKFKPRLTIGPGRCYPHAAVTVDGKISSGLSQENRECVTVQGQVYGRSGWVGTNWGTLYSYFIPYSGAGIFMNVVVWINDPSPSSNQRIVAISLRNANGVFEPRAELDASYYTGDHVEVIYANSFLSVTSDSDGADYNLIMWDQLSDAAKIALNKTSNFDGSPVPFSDVYFNLTLNDASQSV